MSAPEQRDTHLFESTRDCCELWFKSQSTLCQDTIVFTSVGMQLSGPTNRYAGMWYPSLNGKYLCLDGEPPSWIQAEGYADQYVFDSHAECCKAHYCEDIRGVLQSYEIESKRFVNSTMRQNQLV